MVTNGFREEKRKFYWCRVLRHWYFWRGLSSISSGWLRKSWRAVSSLGLIGEDLREFMPISAGIIGFHWGVINPDENSNILH